ncbi:unnamed protein product [Ceutorhynchus assimilis]|uniref:MADF domain-containing protein n=1 Tax=Ceutorhynchus assimilis TaxID=467358 RepID=A0A9P0DLE6_9CUCU|nr:unnamed protein product [Ceutorhynchus assimilis]
MNLDERILVETIQTFPCIWNTKNKEHQNSLIVENAWKSIAIMMAENGKCFFSYSSSYLCKGFFSVESCKDSWKSLRLKYIRERKRSLKMSSGSASYSGNWPLYKSMSFLASVIQTRRSIGHVATKKTGRVLPPLQTHFSSLWSAIVAKDESSLQETSGRTDEDSRAEEAVQNISEGLTPHDSASCTTAITPSGTTSLQPISARQGVKRKQCSATPSPSIKENSADRETQASSEDRYFGLSLAESLGKIGNSKKKMIVKAKILTIMAEALDDD